MKSLKAYYEGRVQGVGFRYTVKREATGYDVAGQVRNLPDGRVELVVAGDDEEVDDFLDAVRNGEMAGNISAVSVEEFIASGPMRGFSICMS